MDFNGMDVGEVEGLTSQMSTQATVVNNVITVVDNAVTALREAWSGDAVEAFANLWEQRYRPQAVQTSADLGTWVGELNREMDQQRSASGYSGGGATASGAALMALLTRSGSIAPGSGNVPVTTSQIEQLLRAGAAEGVPIGVLLSMLPPAFEVAWEKTGDLRTIESISDQASKYSLAAKYGSDWEKYSETLDSSDSDKLGAGLGAVGALMDVVALGQAIDDHDGTATEYDSANVVVDGIDNVPGVDVVVGVPLTTAMMAYSFIGPTSDAQATGITDMALENRFPGVDVNHLKPDQEEWLTSRYEGASGYLHAVEDGIAYHAYEDFGL